MSVSIYHADTQWKIAEFLREKGINKFQLHMIQILVCMYCISSLQGHLSYVILILKITYFFCSWNNWLKQVVNELFEKNVQLKMVYTNN